MSGQSKLSIAKSVMFIILAIIIILLVVAATKPDNFHVERSITINAEPEYIFPLINDFQNWTQWSPWEKKDPELKRTYSSNTRGKGATYAWDGNSKVGQGQMEIMESIEPAKIFIALNFIAPFAAQNTAAFTLTPVGENTQLTWVMKGPNNYMSKVMQVFMSMDTMVGKDFEDGLNQLKAIAESNKNRQTSAQ